MAKSSYAGMSTMVSNFDVNHASWKYFFNVWDWIESHVTHCYKT